MHVFLIVENLDSTNAGSLKFETLSVERSGTARFSVLSGVRASASVGYFTCFDEDARVLYLVTVTTAAAPTIFFLTSPYSGFTWQEQVVDSYCTSNVCTMTAAAYRTSTNTVKTAAVNFMYYAGARSHSPKANVHMSTSTTYTQ